MVDYIDKVICGDCLELMTQIPDKSVDLIVADPPYNIGKASWDKIPDYINWCGKWIAGCQRVLADNGSMYIFHNDFLQMIDLAAYIRDKTAFVFKQMITWCKIGNNNGFAIQRLSNGTMRNYYNGFTEYILFYTFQDETGLKQVYDNRDCFRGIKEYFITEKQKAGLLTCKAINKVIGSAQTGGGMATHYFNVDHSQWCLPTAEMYGKLQTTGYFQRPYEELRQEYEELRYTFNCTWVKDNLYGNSNVWYYMQEIGQHPTQKPVALIENIILHSSNEGNLVLSPFLGSGTDAIACINTGRRFIGMELSPEYCAISEKRISQAIADKKEADRQLIFDAAGD